MTKILLLAPLALLLAQGADLRVDHVTFAGRDLKQIESKLRALGIVSEYGGKHTNGLTEMSIASFADGSYLELIAAQDPKAGAGKHYWGKFIDDNAGPCAWAISTNKLDEEAQRLGGHVTASGRKRGDGVELKWRSAIIPPGIQGTFFPFMIQDETDRKLRAFPSGAPSMPNLQGVSEVHILVRDLDDAIKRYRAAFQLPVPKRSQHEARFVGTPVVLVTAHDHALKDRLEKYGEGPIEFVIGKLLIR